MTAFNIDKITEQPDHICVDIGRRFNVAIQHTDAELSIRI
jgi:hypothetical protein